MIIIRVSRDTCTATSFFDVNSLPLTKNPCRSNSYNILISNEHIPMKNMIINVHVLYMYTCIVEERLLLRIVFG